MAKIIQIIDVDPEGIRVRLDDGSFTTLNHNAGWSPSVGDEIPSVAEPRWNLTDKQWELLEVLVSSHESNGGAEFSFICHFGGCGITYPGAISIPGAYDQTDLLQLRSERLVRLVRSSRNVHRGKPTQLGITTARRHLAKPADRKISDLPALASTEPNPFPTDHRSHQIWAQLPKEVREVLSRFSMEKQAEILELDKVFQQKFAETASLDLLERYSLERFDLSASQLLSVAIPGPTPIKAQYESFLDTFLETGQEQLRTVLQQAMRSDVRDGIISRIALKLSSRKLHWLREEIVWRLQGCPPRSPSRANLRLDGDPGTATETSSSLDAFVRRVAEQERNGRAGGAPLDSIVRADPSAEAEAGANAPNSMVEPPEWTRKRQKTAADLTAAYSRIRRNPVEAGRQEELLRDAWEYAAMTLTAALEELQLSCNASAADIEAACEKIRDRIVLEVLNNYVPRHKYTSDFRLGTREFKAALWTEGFPSLEDRARAGIQEHVALMPVSEKLVATVSDPEPALDQTAGKNGHESSSARSADQPAHSPIDSAAPSRRAAVDSYIEEVFKATGRRITRTEIWKKAGDKSRTEFERWESLWYEKKHRKPNGAANRRFTQILTNKPHIK